MRPTSADERAGRLRSLRRPSSGPSGSRRASSTSSRPSTSVSDGGTLAFYDPTDERVRVRGTEMTVGLEVTLVHELTHALQDQHFDLERLNETRARHRRVDRLPGPGGGRRRCASRTRTSTTSSPTEEQASLRRGVRGGAGRQRGGDERCAAVHERDVRRSRTPSASRSSRCSFNQDGNDGVDDAFERAAGHRGAPLRPGQLPRRRGRRESVELGLRRRRRAARRGTLRRHRAGTCSSPSASTRRWPSRPRSAGTATPSRPYERDGATCVQAGVHGRHRRRRGRRWPTALDEWVDAMPGGAAEVDRGRRPPRPRGLRPRRGPRPRAHRPLRDVAVPAEPLGLPGRRRRRRRSDPTRQPVLRPDRGRRARPTRRSPTPRARRSTSEGFQADPRRRPTRPAR